MTNGSKVKDAVNKGELWSAKGPTKTQMKAQRKHVGVDVHMQISEYS